MANTQQQGTLRARGVHVPTALVPLPPSILALATDAPAGELDADLETASRYDSRSGVQDVDLLVALPGAARLDLKARLSGIHYDLARKRIDGQVERAELRLDDEGLVGRLVPPSPSSAAIRCRRPGTG